MLSIGIGWGRNSEQIIPAVMTFAGGEGGVPPLSLCCHEREGGGFGTDILGEDHESKISVYLKQP